LCADAECIIAYGPIAQFKIQFYREMVRMSSRATADLLDAAPIAQSMIERFVERIGNEPQRIEKIALARAVRADQKQQGSQANIAFLDALVVAETDSRDEGRIVHSAVSVN